MGRPIVTVRSDLSERLGQWRWWRDFRRIRGEGLINTLHRWRLWRRVLASAPVHADAPSRGRVEIHLLCHRGDHLCAIWALKTLYLTSGTRWPALVHLQGTVTRAMIRRFRHHLPDARLIEPHEADARVVPALESHYPRLLEARRLSPFMMKLIDPVLFASADRIVILDSDVLFFRDPHQLRTHAEHAPEDTWLFQRDPVSTYNITESVASTELGIQMPDRVNSGIAVVPRGLVDFDLCERLLAHPSVCRPSGWIEQTLFALCAGARGRVEYLSPSYAISLERGLDYAAFTARHYAGPSRSLLTEEGMPYVRLQNCLGLQSRS